MERLKEYENLLACYKREHEENECSNCEESLVCNYVNSLSPEIRIYECECGNVFKYNDLETATIECTKCESRFIVRNRMLLELVPRQYN